MKKRKQISDMLWHKIKGLIEDPIDLQIENRLRSRILDVLFNKADFSSWQCVNRHLKEFSIEKT